MKLLLTILATATLLLHTSFAYVISHSHSRQCPSVFLTSRRAQANRRFMTAVELEPEPEGGEELTPIKSSPDTRMKKMKEVPDVKSDDDMSMVYEFWMTAVADGALVKEIRTTILKDASKKANFPGFRKGQVPPYAQPQITQFAVQEAIIKTIEAVVDSYGLKSLKGSAGEVNVNEDVTAMAKGYKTGDSLPFTASLKAVLDTEKQTDADKSEEAVEEVITD